MLSLGSNRGDRLAWLKRACEALAARPGFSLTACSPVYETEPVGVRPEFEGHLYLNQVVIVETALEPEAFSEAVHDIERQLGRTRVPATPNLPRTIDIDIVAFGELRSDLPALTLPHPRARTRRFVLQPLADLRPDYVLPGETRTVSELLSRLPEKPGVCRLTPT